MKENNGNAKARVMKGLGAVGLIGASLGMGSLPAGAQTIPPRTPATTDTPVTTSTTQVKPGDVKLPDGTSRQLKIDGVDVRSPQPSVQQKLTTTDVTSRQLKLTAPKAEASPAAPPK